MTVCIAARCGGSTEPYIIGAVDRMLTAGDVEFEPDQAQTKIGGLTTSICVMIAGDAALQAEILLSVQAEVGTRIAAEPTNWWKVAEVADLYSRYYLAARLRRTDVEILGPLGLDRNTFLARQQELVPELVQQVATELLNYRMPPAEAIFAGSDPSGLHIYVVRDGQVSCEDAVGFAAIGSGAGHANSQFMFARHGWAKGFTETLMLAYSAKRRAEVAPGVGLATDMFTVGARLGSLSDVADHVVEQLRKMYDKMALQERKAFLDAQKSTDKYVKAIVEAAAAKGQATAPKDSGGNAPADKKELPGDRTKGESAT